MQNLEFVINPSNAIYAIRYLLNLDLNALNEKAIKMGIANIIDVERTKRLCCILPFENHLSFYKTTHLVQQAIDFTRALNEDAKQHLLEYLAVKELKNSAYMN